MSFELVVGDVLRRRRPHWEAPFDTGTRGGQQTLRLGLPKSEYEQVTHAARRCPTEDDTAPVRCKAWRFFAPWPLGKRGGLGRNTAHHDAIPNPADDAAANQQRYGAGGCAEDETALAAPRQEIAHCVRTGHIVVEFEVARAVADHQLVVPG